MNLYDFLTIGLLLIWLIYSMIFRHWFMKKIKDFVIEEGKITLIIKKE